MKYFEYIAAAVAITGAFFNKWGLPGANILVMVGLFGLAFLYGLAGSVFFKIKEKRGSIMPYTVFSSISLAAGVLSLLFSHMGWSGSGILAVYSFIAIPLVLIVNIYQLTKKTENPLHKMIVIRAIILIVALIVF
jgi:hypothetical protein